LKSSECFHLAAIAIEGNGAFGRCWVTSLAQATALIVPRPMALDEMIDRPAIEY